MQFELIIKKLNNQLSSEEEIIFTEWYNSDTRHREYFNKIRKTQYKNFEPLERKLAWSLVSRRLNLKKPIPYRKLAIVASFIALIGLVSYFNLNKYNSASICEPTYEPEIATILIEQGKGKAILTLGNGTDVVLTNKGYQNQNIKSNGSELIYDSYNSDSVEEEIVYNYLSVPRGGEFFVQLSDGTKVWLNSDSKLKFPVKFIGNSREVELVYGEAYFEVSSSILHQGASFIVRNQNQTIEVLGTEFNLKAYIEDKSIVTTLVEGEVSLWNSEMTNVKYLSPSQQATFSLKTNKLNIEIVNTNDATAWRNGILRFQNKSLKDIMFSLSRWYDLEVDFEDSAIEQQKFNGIFRKTQEIENILESIQKTEVATFQKDGKKIFVKNPKK